MQAGGSPGTAPSGATQLPPPRLICFTDLDVAPLETTIERFGALARRARPSSVLFVLRDKQRPLGERLAFGRRLAPVIEAQQQRFGVAESLDLAELLGVAAMHLGENGPSTAAARQLLGAGGFVSRACHDPARASDVDADAVLLSPILAPRKGRPALGLEVLAEVARQLGPQPALYALGGIDADGAQRCLAAGAAGVSVIGEALRPADPAPLLAALGILRGSEGGPQE
jgi:thiamine-phosphate pyrophosphorylase